MPFGVCVLRFFAKRVHRLEIIAFLCICVTVSPVFIHNTLHSHLCVSLCSQEIPFRHIWSGNQSGLHCSFALEHADRQQYHLSCHIHVFQKELLPNRQLLQISCNLKEVRAHQSQTQIYPKPLTTKVPCRESLEVVILEANGRQRHGRTKEHMVALCKTLTHNDDVDNQLSLGPGCMFSRCVASTLNCTTSGAKTSCKHFWGV